MADPFDTDVPDSKGDPFDTGPLPESSAQYRPAVRPHTAQGFFEEIEAGLQIGAAGLKLRGTTPDIFHNPDAPWYQRLAGGLAQFASDAPAMAIGAFGGAAIPAPPSAKLALAGAGAFAAPAMIRSALMDYYTTGQVDYQKMAVAGLKQGVVGAITTYTGGLLGGAARFGMTGVIPEATTVLGNVGRQAAIGAGELGAMTAAQSVMDWHLPAAQDFFDNAVMIFGLRGAKEFGVPLLMKVYEETGMSPKDTAAIATRDSSVAQQLNAGEIPHQFERESPAVLRSGRTGGRYEAPEKVGPPEVTEAIRDRATRNLREFDDENGMHESISVLAQEAIAGIETSRRGVVSDQQLALEGTQAARAIADMIGTGKTRKAGESLKPAEVIGYAKAIEAAFRNVKSASEDLMEAQRQHTEGKLSEQQLTDQLAQYAIKESQLKALTADYLGGKAELGRAMRAIQQVQKLTGDVKALQELLAEKGTGIEALMQRAALIKSAESNHSINNIIRSSKYFDKVVEYWKASILSGPTTHIRNMVSNVLFGASRTVNTFLAAAISEARGKDAVMYREVVGELYGSVMGLLEGVRVASKVFKDAYIEDKEPTTSKAEGAVDRAKGAIGTDSDSNKTGKIFGKAVRSPFTALSAMDGLSSSIVKYMTAYGKAARETKGNLGDAFSNDFYTRKLSGVLKSKEFNEEAGTGQREFEPGQGELAKLMTSEANRYTFMTELSPRAKHVMVALYDLPVVKYILPFMFPFVRTPYNVFREAMRGLPAFGAFSSKQQELWRQGGAARDRALAEHVAGTAMAVTVLTLVQSDVITGGGPSPTGDPTRRRAWLQTHEPYSVRIGDKWYSYNWAEPFATQIGIMADLASIKHMMSDNEYEMAAHMTLASFTNQVTHKSFLQTFTTLASLLDPDQGGGNPASAFAAQVASGFIPNIISQPAKQLDPQTREARTFVDRLQNRVPYWREGLLPQRDLFGEPIPHERAWDFMGIQVKPAHDDPVRQELSRLGYAPQPMRNTESPDQFNLPSGKRPEGMNVFGGAMGDMARVQIPDQQFDAMRTEAGKMAYPILDKLVRSPGYQHLPDFEKRGVIESVFSDSRFKAKWGGGLTSDQINQAKRELRKALGVSQ